MHRQEGRGNSAGALLGAAIITGKSAVMYPGQIVNAFTAEPIMSDALPATSAPVATAAVPTPRIQNAPKRQRTGGVRCVTCQN